MEYLERKQTWDPSMSLDTKANIESVVSRQGFWVCFCRYQLNTLERKKDYLYTFNY